MDISQVIDKRISRRTYSQTRLSHENIEKLQSIIDEINNASDLSIKFVTDGKDSFSDFLKGYGVFKNVQSYFAMIGKISDENVFEKVGYYGEKLVLEATELGLGTCWIAGTYDKKKMANIVGYDEILTCIVTVGNISDQSLQEKAVRRMVRRKTKTIKELYTSNEEVPQWFLKGLESVQKAPSAANRQPVVFGYNNGKVTASVPKKFDFELIDLGIAKYHFEIMSGYKFENK